MIENVNFYWKSHGWYYQPQEIPLTVSADSNIAEGACFRTKQIEMYNLKKAKGCTKQNIKELNKITFHKSFLWLNQQCTTYPVSKQIQINTSVHCQSTN